MVTTSCAVICDYLDVTCPPDSETPHSVLSLVDSYCTDQRSTNDGSQTLVDIGGGILKLEFRKQFSRISASGQVLVSLRLQKLFDSYLDTLGSGAHRVTRLDAALDTAEDGADVIARLRRKYRRKNVSFTRKQLPVSFLTSRRESDNRETGTFYVGHRSRAQVTARIYDKANELLDKRGIELSSPKTRYELTVRREVGASLRDASEPDRIFWHFMSPEFLKCPKEIPDWEMGWGGEWFSDRPEFDPGKRLKGLVENSSVLDRMITVADELGPNGRRQLVRWLSRRVGVSLD